MNSIDNLTTLKVKCFDDGLVSYKNAAFHIFKTLINELESCELLVDYCDICTLILTAPIHCRESFGEQVSKQGEQK